MSPETRSNLLLLTLVLVAFFSYVIRPVTSNADDCLALNKTCEVDYDCCDPDPSDPTSGAECKDKNHRQRCEPCKNYGTSCKSDEDCCSLLDCAKGKCCALKGNRCEKDENCCSSRASTKTIVCEAHSILKNQPHKCVEGPAAATTGAPG